MFTWFTAFLAGLTVAGASLLGGSGLTYRPDLASWGLDLSNAAYCEKPEIESWSCEPCKRLEAADVRPLKPPQVFDGVVGGYGPAVHWGTRAVVTASNNDFFGV